MEGTEEVLWSNLYGSKSTTNTQQMPKTPGQQQDQDQCRKLQINQLENNGFDCDIVAMDKVQVHGEYQFYKKGSHQVLNKIGIGEKTELQKCVDSTVEPR